MQHVDELPAGERSVLDRLRFDEAHPDLVRPNYDGYGIVNLPWTVMEVLGIPIDGTPLAPGLLPPALTDGVRAVLVIVVDALGYTQLRSAMAAGDAPTLREMATQHTFFPLSSTFPSTTVAALTSLQTGVPPSRHGMVGYTLYLREYGALTNLIRFGPMGRFDSYAASDVDPRSFLPVPTIYDRAREAGVPIEMVNYRAFERTALTRIHAADVPYRTYNTLGEMGTGIREALREPGRRLVVAYWPMVDLIGHKYGPEGAASIAEVRLLDAMLRREVVEPLRREDLLVVLTADHGQVQLDPASARSLNDHPDLLAGLIVPPTGERRIAYFYPRPGAEAEVRERLQEIAGDDAWVVRSQRLLDLEFFGPEPRYAELALRVGEVALMANGAASFPYSMPGEPAQPMRGAHGALQADEMLVPCLIWRASEVV